MEHGEGWSVSPSSWREADWGYGTGIVLWQSCLTACRETACTDQIASLQGKCRAMSAGVQCCEEQLSDGMFYMVFLPTPPTLSYILTAEIPMCLLWEGTTCSQWHWGTGPFLRYTGAREIHSYFCNAHSMPSVGWAQEGSPSQGGHTWLWSAGNGEDRGEPASHPDITNTNTSPERANVSIAVKFDVSISD